MTPKPRTKVEAMAWFMAYHRAPTSADIKHAADDLEELHQLGWTLVPLDDGAGCSCYGALGDDLYCVEHGA